MRTALICVILAGAGSILAADDAFVRDTRDWHAKRIERLRGETGWLTLVGLHWLEPGENRFGSSPDLPVILPKGLAPAVAGSFVLEGGKVRIRAEASAGLTVDGDPVTERVLATDVDAKPDVIHLGRLRLVVIKRGDRFGVRVRDPQSPVRTGFKGIETFPPDPKFRIVARWEAYPTPKAIEVPSVLGTVETQAAPGIARFAVEGQPCTLEPILEDPKAQQLFVIFKDATSGRETYPLGRFLYVDLPKDGRLVLDFNRAYNPPCAFTPYATCPLPPKQNHLAVRIEAGEKTFGAH